jgi:diguanylate cyclase (GGDEF)-like protein
LENGNPVAPRLQELALEPSITLSYPISEGTASSGILIALFAIWALQYVTQFLKKDSRLRLQTDAHRALDGVEDELAAANRDRALAQFESQAIHEFLTNKPVERALAKLLRRYVAHSDSDFAVFLLNRPEGLIVAESYGLSEESVRNLRVDSCLLSRIALARSAIVAGPELRASTLWNSLTSKDRAKAPRLHLVLAGNGDEFLGLLIATSLAPRGVQPDDQIYAARRILDSITGSLRDKSALREHENELQSTNEMLALRAVTDRQFDSPVQMISEFVRETAVKIDADRSTIYVVSTDADRSLKALARSGGPLPAGALAQWNLHEDRLAAEGLKLQEPRLLSSTELAGLGIDTLVGAALIVSVRRQDRQIAVLCFTRQQPEKFSEKQRRLGAFAAELLSEMLPRFASQVSTERRAKVDGLTGLANRAQLDEAIVRAVNEAREQNQPCTLLMFDLDRFKSINDSLGHRAGDAVLKATSKVLQECAANIRGADRARGVVPVVARYGGEELAVLLPLLGHKAGQRIGEMIRQRIESLAIEFEGRQIHVTTSGGIASFPEHAATADGLVAAADAALYAAKAAGRNCIQMAQSQAPAIAPVLA